MKKIVIAMLLILPLIIVATVLVATSIISNEVYIAVENVVLNVRTDQTIVLGLSEEQFQLQATVYPTSARNKGVKWKVENVQCFGDEIEHPITISDNGLLKLYTYCTFDVVVTTNEASKRARANFYVKADAIKGVTVQGSDSINLGESAMLKAVFDPVDAEAENALWQSDNEEVLFVDGNGIISAKSVGSAVISVVVDGKHTATKEISVVAGVTKFGRNFATAKSSFEIASLGINGTINDIFGATIEGGIFTFTQEVATLTVGEELVTITRCQEGDIAFRNIAFFEGKLLSVGKLPLYLDVVYKDVFADQKPDFTLTSSDDSVAPVGNLGEIRAAKKGNVTFTANSGNKTITVSFIVIRPVNFIRMNTVDGDDKRGIAQQTIYGNKSYSGESLVNYELPFFIQYPEQADWEDYIVTVSSDAVQFVDNKIVVVGDLPEFTTLTITVTAKYSAYESMEVRTRRNIRVINGVNCSNYQDLSRASSEGKAIMVQNNIVLGKTDSMITLKNDFYGNGYLVDATNADKNYDTPIVLIKSDGVTMSNTQIRGDDIVNINKANGLSGYLVVIGEIEQEERFLDITIEYSIFENGYFGMDMHNADVYLNGSIVRNTSNFGISLPSNRRSNGESDYSNLTMNNCVMSNIVATAVGISTNSKNLAVQSNFYSTGFLDIYNWQDVTSMRMLDRDIIPGDDAMNDFLKNAISTVLKKEIKRAEYDHIRLTIGDTDYFHLGIVTAGALNMNNSIVEIEDERYVKLPLEVLDIFKLEPCVLYIYSNEANIKADTVYEESEELYTKLRGDN